MTSKIIEETLLIIESKDSILCESCKHAIKYHKTKFYRKIPCEFNSCNCEGFYHSELKFYSTMLGEK